VVKKTCKVLGKFTQPYPVFNPQNVASFGEKALHALCLRGAKVWTLPVCDVRPLNRKAAGGGGCLEARNRTPQLGIAFGNPLAPFPAPFFEFNKNDGCRVKKERITDFLFIPTGAVKDKTPVNRRETDAVFRFVFHNGNLPALVVLVQKSGGFGRVVTQAKKRGIRDSQRRRH
jgi:hypothetical protein